GAGYALWLTAGEAVLSLQSGDRKSSIGGPADTGVDQEKRAAITGQTPHRPAPQTQAAVIRMKLVNANRAASAAGEEEMAGRSNYFIGNEASKWRAGISSYAKVVCRSIYRGVDVVYYGNGRELEYDFKVAAGANPAA